MENTGGNQQQQMQEMQAMVMKMAASAQNVRPASRGEQDVIGYAALLSVILVEASMEGMEASKAHKSMIRSGIS